jgi:hypothetical protein
MREYRVTTKASQLHIPPIFPQLFDVCRITSTLVLLIAITWAKITYARTSLLEIETVLNERPYNAGVTCSEDTSTTREPDVLDWNSL